MPTPQELAIQALLGSNSPSNVASPTGLVHSRLRREDLQKEMLRNRELADTSARPASPGFGSGIGWQAPTPAYRGGISGATNADLADISNELGDSPNFGTDAVSGLKQYTAKLRDANLQGFATPPEEAAYNQRMESEKINMPQTVAKTTAASDLARQQEISRGNLAVEQERQSGKGSQYDLVRELMGGNFSDKAPKSVSVPGVFGATFNNETGNNPAIYARLDAARKAYEASKSFGGFGSGDPALKAEVDKLTQLAGLGGTSSSGGGDPEIDSFAQDIVNDIDSKNLSWVQLQPMLPPELTPAQREQLRVTLSRLRGGF